MKRIWILPVITVLAITVQMFVFEDSDAKNEAVPSVALTVDPNTSIPITKRTGMNLGTWTSWGAEQLSHNILMNPGFEGKFSRGIVIVTSVEANKFSDEKDLGYPDGYWKGGTYEVRSGPSAGKQGKIVDSLLKGASGFPEYVTKDPLPPLSPQDVIVLLKENILSDELASWWVLEQSKGRVFPDPKEHRPDSPGTQSAKLIVDHAGLTELHYYLDAITPRSGKLLLVEGEWLFSIWAKSDSEADSLHVTFARLNDTAPFFEHFITLSKEWQHFEMKFTAKDKGKPEILKLSLGAQGANHSSIWVDDVFLGQAEKSKSGFRKDVVEDLMKLKPAYLRDYQGQLADSFKNRIADEYARQAFTFQLTGMPPTWMYGYSIPSLLTLCEEVGANPWIVLPTTLTDEESKEVGEFLLKNAHANRFTEVYIEFGNENWNSMFRPAGIPYPEQCGAVADRIFTIIKEITQGHVNVRSVMQGQYEQPEIALQFLGNTPHADVLAVAPYFFYEVNADHPEKDNLALLFSDDDKNLKRIKEGVLAKNKQLAFYEYNLHSTKGTADGKERNPIVSGAASGTALARRTIQGLFQQANPAIVYCLAGFDTRDEVNNDYVNLWGVFRDLSATNRMRPTGLAITMLNNVVGGSLHPIKVPDGVDPELLKMGAFRTSSGWKAVVASQSDVPLAIELVFPDDGKILPNKGQSLHFDSPFNTNEEDEKVRIESIDIAVEGRKVHFTIPAWGLVVLPASIEIKK